MRSSCVNPCPTETPRRKLTHTKFSLFQSSPMQQASHFFKFPKTPHLAGSSTVDDDQIISKSDLKAFAANSYVVIQEKVDGIPLVKRL